MAVKAIIIDRKWDGKEESQGWIAWRRFSNRKRNLGRKSLRLFLKRHRYPVQGWHSCSSADGGWGRHPSTWIVRHLKNVEKQLAPQVLDLINDSPYPIVYIDQMYWFSDQLNLYISHGECFIIKREKTASGMKSTNGFIKMTTPDLFIMKRITRGSKSLKQVLHAFLVYLPGVSSLRYSG